MPCALTRFAWHPRLPALLLLAVAVQCLTAAQVKAEALDLMGAAPSLPSLCREVTPDFKCASCVSGYTLTITNKVRLCLCSCLCLCIWR